MDTRVLEKRARDACDSSPTIATHHVTSFPRVTRHVFPIGARSCAVKTVIFPLALTTPVAQIPVQPRNCLPPCAAVNTFLSSRNAMPVPRPRGNRLRARGQPSLEFSTFTQREKVRLWAAKGKLYPLRRSLKSNVFIIQVASSPVRCVSRHYRLSATLRTDSRSLSDLNIKTPIIPEDTNNR